MNNDEFYDSDAYDAAMQEEYDNEMIQEAFQEKYNSNLFYDEFTDTYYEKSSVPMTEQDLITSANWANYNDLFLFMRDKPFLSLSLGIEDGLPYYETEVGRKKMKIFITKEIYQQIHNYLKNGIIPDKMPEAYKVYKNMNEYFILRHYKADNANEVTSYSLTSKEHLAMYKNGIIRYIQLPYTTDELKAKLNSL
ncbi:MAG: hypothetical protein FWC34_02520 [Bacteroidetes bacterium]|nr:hypothetical protein [Bacteroidota bacterium]